VSDQADNVVFEFEAGRHTFRACVSNFRGVSRIDLREWYEAEPGQQLAPSRKGVNLPAEYVDELRQAVDALAAAVKVSSTRSSTRTRAARS
jgi:Transcriptional Coactivator p15 (PC4)